MKPGGLPGSRREYRSRVTVSWRPCDEAAKRPHGTACGGTGFTPPPLAAFPGRRGV